MTDQLWVAKQMYIYPEIYKDFSCRMCGTCCRNPWQVTMDRDSYLRNEALFADSGRQAEFAQAIIRLSESSGFGEYAYIAKQTGGSCWFLDQSNLCLLHKTAGHSHLDAVCRTFPRYPMSTARGIELALSFCCPAVVALADREQPLTIIRTEQSPAERVAEHYAVYVYPAQQQVNTPLYHYFEMETHFIDLMQCRAMAFNDRLDFLAATTQAVAALPQDQTFSHRLTALFSKNYDWLDELAAACPPPAFLDGDGLVENFLVNFVFKKPFYLYGFDKTLQLLNYLYRQVVNANDVADAIRQFEFQYGHEPQALLRNT